MIETKSHEDRFERMERDFHNRLREGFLAIAKAEPDRCRVIDASGDIDTVAAAVRASLSELLGVDVK